ncbi:MAG TPA: uracil-DNA glycosylase family protein [Gemmatimonadaceae bacterium]|nr:uracil-DNA glycosylase family protein [Gemmatimonadaceae bacterium]
MNPHAEPGVRAGVKNFLDAFYGDNAERVLVFGINPGRFGAGITGVTFTDPVALARHCGIGTGLPRQRELSSVFIYEMIERLGGPRHFYKRYFLTAVSPLGFTRGGINMNYYDDRALTRAVTPFIVRTIAQQIALGGSRKRAIVLGIGDNARFLHDLNEKHGFFEKIEALEHPRWIMQYRRKKLDTYLAKYEDLLARSP